MKIRPVGTELFRADGKMTFRDFCGSAQKTPLTRELPSYG